MSDDARPPSRSLTEMTEILLPQHANALGTAFGGTILSWIDICAAIAAQRHCGRTAVTIALDEMLFRAPVRVGDVVRLLGRVNATFGSSLEVEVTVEREHPRSGERTPCADALLTFVGLDDEGRPSAVPALLCETDEDRARRDQAMARREERLLRRGGGAP